MKPRYLFAILATITMMFLFFWKDRESTKPFKNGSNESSNVARLGNVPKTTGAQQNQVNPTPDVKDKPSQTNKDADQIEEVQKSFSAHLRQLAQCLAVTVAVDQEKIDPHFDNLVVSLNPAFGNVLVKMDDWTQWDIEMQDGTKRRIRTETEYLENNIPTKRAQLYKLNQQGMPEMQTLGDDQVNPTDEYLESLRGDGRTYIDEKASRSYYAEGEELVVVERNGKVQSFSVNKGEKTFSCSETDSVTSNCQCL